METTISTNQQLINTLLLNASFIDNSGLLNGKMGISICFFHLARQTKNKIYEDYAGELIDEIYEEITADTPLDFENGLAGIGWGIEYLVQNGFIEADTDEVLEDFDNRIFKELIYNTPKNLGLLNGLLGIGAYFLKRLQNTKLDDEKILTLTNKQTLNHLIDKIDTRTQDASVLIQEPKKFNKQESKWLNKFDITWDYPLLIWFLAELLEQNLINLQNEEILHRIIQPINKENWLPRLQSNRLLLQLALTKLSYIKKLNGFAFHELHKKVEREVIKSEIGENNTNLKTGTLSISWIYQQLFQLTSDGSFKREMKYWNNLEFIVETRNNMDEFSAVTTGINLGILNGLAGKIIMANS